MIRTARHRIPLPDAHGLALPLRLSRAVRLGLAVCLAVGAALAFLAARGVEDSSAAAVIEPGQGGIVVLDVSSSVASQTYLQIERALSEIAVPGRKFGFVVFSDVAYEALPPGTPSSELRSYIRYFKPLRREPPPGYPSLSPGTLPYVRNPWAGGFSGGTRISAGLKVARYMIERDRVRDPFVVLISDLDDDATDIPELSDTVIGYVRDKITLRAVGLSPEASDKALFQRLLRSKHAVAEAPAPPRRVDVEPVEGGVATFPTALALACLGVLALLAANELLCGRLTWGVGRRAA